MLKQAQVIAALAAIGTAVGAIAMTTPSVLAQEGGQEETPAARLVVLVTVDQMRADYLDRYGDDFQGGFARLLAQGRRFDNAWVEHALTNSLPGHTTIATGRYPFEHGMIDNGWYDNTVEPAVYVPGYSLANGDPEAASRIEATTIVEWVLAADPEARFVALSSIRNAPRLYVGTARGPVVWLAPSRGGYAGFAPYMDATPAWAARFNSETLEARMAEAWDVNLPANVRARLRADDVAFENDGRDTHFPHTSGEGQDQLEWFYATPGADVATLELAAQAVRAEALGQDDHPDILVIGLNSLDEVGHSFGPLSVEQADALFALDAALGTLMETLDEQVGQGRWSLVLTADHGVATAPEARNSAGSVEGVRMSPQEARSMVEAAYAAADSERGFAARAEAAARAIERFPNVRRAYTPAELAAIEPSTETADGLYAISSRAGRTVEHPFYFDDLPLAALGVTVMLEEDVVVDWAAAIHGSPWDYDRRVPLIVFGAGVTPGRDGSHVATVDVAPTLAHLAGATPLGPIDGAVLDLGGSQ